VTAGNRTLSAANSATLTPGDYVRIEIRDHGVGIPNEYINNIFDPYFTTKQGSGLGLATAYSVIKKHEGHIRANSVAGEGTTITIYLPASQGKAPAPPSPVSQPGVQGSNVLLMDDEALVRNTGRRMLERLGYRVTTAKDGAEALWLYRENLEADDRFDMVIMDLTVPGGMGALEAVEKLKATDPDARVFISSGYANDPVMNNCYSYGFQGVVRKPYTLDEITEVIGYAKQV
jgi:two-component system, cell cycle sensor histidine kinase and response regulator CckA